MEEPILKKKNVIIKKCRSHMFVTISTASLLIFIIIVSSYAVFNSKSESEINDIVVQSGNLLAKISSTDSIEINYDKKILMKKKI